MHITKKRLAVITVLLTALLAVGLAAGFSVIIETPQPDVVIEGLYLLNVSILNQDVTNITFFLDSYSTLIGFNDTFSNSTNYTFFWNTSSVSDGLYTLLVNATNWSGANVTNSSGNVRIDNNAPTWSSESSNTTIRAREVLLSVYWQDTFNSSSYLFSTNNSGMWVNGSWTSFNGLNWSNSSILLNDTVGVHVGWMVYANDSLNHMNQTSVFTIVTTGKPNTLPQAPILFSPVNLSQTGNLTPNFWFNATDAENATLNCSLYVNGSWTASAVASNGSNESVNYTFGSYGDYLWYINCSDGEFVNASIVASLNLTDGVSPAFLSVFNYSITNESAVVNFTLDKLANATLTLNGTNYTNSSFLSDYLFNLIGLNASTLYVYTITACNQWGYCNETGPYNFTTQVTPVNTPPDVPTLYYPVNTSQIGNLSVWFWFNATDAENATLNCSVYVNGSWVAWAPASNGTNASVNYSFGSYGNYSWYVNCSDGEYWSSSADAWIHHIDNVPPTFLSVFNYSITNESAVVNFTLDKLGNMTVTLNGTNHTNTSFRLNHIIALSGLNASAQYVYALIACNLWGYCNETGPYSFTTNATPTPNAGPDGIEAFYPVSDTQNDNLTVFFWFNVMDPDNATLSCGLYINGTLNQTNASVANSTNTSFTWAFGAYGDYSWSVNCTDGEYFNWTAPAAFTLADTVPPAISGVVNHTITNVSAIVNFSIDKLANATIALNSSVNYTDTSFNTSHSIALSGLSPNTSYSYTVYACNPCGYCASDGPYLFNTTPTAPNTPPNVTLLYPTDGLQLNNTATATFNFSVIDNTSASLTCTLYINGSANATDAAVSNDTNSELATGIGNGFYQWLVSCTDGEYAVNSTVFGLTVADTQPPAFHSIVLSEDYVQSGTNVTITVNASDAYGIAGVTAEGVSLSYAAGLWSGTIALADKAEDNVTVNATDSNGNVAINTSTAYTIDDLDPVFGTITVTPNIITSSATVAYAVGCEDNTTVVSVTAEGHSLTYNGTHWTGSGATQGDDVTSVYAVDRAGNAGWDNSTPYFTDDEAPALAITYPTQLQNVSNKTVVMQYTITDAFPNASWGYQDYQPVAINVSGTNRTLAFVYPGIHYLHLCANDTAGNSACVNRTFRITNYTMVISNWTAVLNGTINASNISVLHPNGTAVNETEEMNRSLTITIEKETITVEIENVTGSEASWETPFDMSVNDTNLTQEVEQEIGTQAIDSVRLTNFSLFLNDSAADYTGVVYLPHNPSFYGRIHYCGNDSFGECEQVPACTQPRVPSPCYGDNGTRTKVYVPHFSGVFGANDTVVPSIAISSPADAGTLGYSYNIPLLVSASETANCSWVLNTNASVDFTQTGAESFSALLAIYENAAHTINVSCADGAGNEAWNTTTFTISDLSAAQPSLTVTDTTSSITFSWTQLEPVNYSVRYGLNASYSSNDSSSSFTTSHSHTISSLSASTRYYYNVTVCDRLGNCNSTASSEVTDATSSGSGDDEDEDESSSSRRSSAGLPGLSLDTERVTKIISSLDVGVTTVWTISKEILAVTEVRITAAMRIGSATITLTKLSGRPGGVTTLAGGIFQYLEFEKTGITDAQLGDVDISFRVPKSWLSDQGIVASDVQLYRFTEGGWIALPTTRTGNDDADYYYTASSAGFSYFAIGGPVTLQPSGTAGAAVAGTNGTEELVIPEINGTLEEGLLDLSPDETTTPREITAEPDEVPVVGGFSTPWWLWTLVGFVVGVGVIGAVLIFVNMHFRFPTAPPPAEEGSAAAAAAAEEPQPASEEGKTTIAVAVKSKVKPVKRKLGERKAGAEAELAEAVEAAKASAKEGFEVVFQLADGRQVRNLHDLLDALSEIDDDTFRLHVTDEKNEISDWVRHVFEDYKLASQIDDVRVREEMCRKIETRLIEVGRRIKKQEEKSLDAIENNLARIGITVPEAKIRQLMKYVKHAFSHQEPEVRVREDMISVGWPEEVVDEVLKEIRSS
ncbi:PGF-pre-PGF domain-containing protein [Candidatus Woesearchaeota archaeon]|nr:PGF-pre-PGF domain-containing protein [Candidatus Woesearchaeota archaeon]